MKPERKKVDEIISDYLMTALKNDCYGNNSTYDLICLHQEGHFYNLNSESEIHEILKTYNFKTSDYVFK